MSHARKVIRDYVAAQIAAAIPAVPVYIGKVWLEDATDLPAINILTPSDERDTTWGRTAQPLPGPYHEVYALDLEVEIRAIASVAILDVLDGYAASIQVALSTDLLWGGIVKVQRLAGTDVELSSELQAPTGALVMQYAVAYEVDMRAPAAPI